MDQLSTSYNLRVATHYCIRVLARVRDGSWSSWGDAPGSVAAVALRRFESSHGCRRPKECVLRSLFRYKQCSGIANATLQILISLRTGLINGFFDAEGNTKFLKRLKDDRRRDSSAHADVVRATDFQ